MTDGRRQHWYVSRLGGPERFEHAHFFRTYRRVLAGAARSSRLLCSYPGLGLLGVFVCYADWIGLRVMGSRESKSYLTLPTVMCMFPTVLGASSSVTLPVFRRRRV